MRRGFLALALLIAALLIPRVSAAHEVRPAYLEIREGADRQVHVYWKQPVVGDLAVPLAPDLSSGWLRGDAGRQQATSTFLVKEWTIPAPHLPLPGQRLAIAGLDRTLTDVLVRISAPEVGEATFILRPATPGITIPTQVQAGAPILDYLRMGVTHIWTGFDHLLYLLGLILLIPKMRTLLKTITAFTVAHSLTLAASVLNVLHVSAAAVEAVIALSIVFVAVELVHAQRGQGGLAQAYPWVVAFGFGLLHGLGFASALREVGLPQHDLPLALMLFNVGIEIGQLAFVAAVTLFLASIARAPRLLDVPLRAAPYAIGGMGAFWVIQRVELILIR